MPLSLYFVSTDDSLRPYNLCYSVSRTNTESRFDLFDEKYELIGVYSAAVAFVSHDIPRRRTGIWRIALRPELLSFVLFPTEATVRLGRSVTIIAIPCSLPASCNYAFANERSPRDTHRHRVRDVPGRGILSYPLTRARARAFTRSRILRLFAYEMRAQISRDPALFQPKSI